MSCLPEFLILCHQHCLCYLHQHCLSWGYRKTKPYSLLATNVETEKICSNLEDSPVIIHGWSSSISCTREKGILLLLWKMATTVTVKIIITVKVKYTPHLFDSFTDCSISFFLMYHQKINYGDPLYSSICLVGLWNNTNRCPSWYLNQETSEYEAGPLATVV